MYDSLSLNLSLSISLSLTHTHSLSLSLSLSLNSVRGSSSPRLAKAEIGAPANVDLDDDNSPMPDKPELDIQFRALMDTMNVPPDHERDLLAMPDERKWKLIRSSTQTSVATPPDRLVEQLRRHLDPELRNKKVKKPKLKDLEVSYDILRKLEVALRTNASNWVEEFCDPPNSGHLVLIEFMEDLPDALEFRSPIPVLQRLPEEHHLGILCLKALMRHDYGLRKVLDEHGFVNRIILNLASEVPRTRTAIVQMMAALAANPGGGALRTLDAFHYFSSRVLEHTRFETVVRYMTDNRADDDYIVACLRLFTTLLRSTDQDNTRIYIQMDLERAGLLDQIKTMRSHTNRIVERLVNEYEAELLDVVGVLKKRDEYRKLYLEATEQLSATKQNLQEASIERDELRHNFEHARVQASDLEQQSQAQSKEIEALKGKLNKTRATLLEQEELLNDQQKQMQELEDEVARAAEQLRQQQLAFKRQAQRRRNAPMRDSVDTTSATADTNADSLPPPPPPPAPPMPNSDAPAAPVPPAPPLPPNLVAPPAPPLPGGGGIPPAPPIMSFGYAPDGMKPKRRIHPNVALPFLNWRPLRKITDTIFEELDDEAILATFDFAEFESAFRVKEGKGIDELRKKAGKRHQESITVLEANRAHNCVITTRRVGMSSEDLRATVLSTDLTLLPAEHAELLLNYVPSPEEVAALEKHTHHRERLAEAERFMLETLNVDRFESRLRVMAYIGYFDEVVLQAMPQIEAVLAASQALQHSTAFKKLLEIILAFGNYMNSAKRGPAYGFKIETFKTLLDTKSSDRKMTLLHYLVKVVQNHYPDVERFIDDLEAVGDAARVSIVTLSTDVQGLRKGIDLVLYEREKQQNNFILHSFYLHAVQKVARIAERFNSMSEQYRRVCVLYNEVPDKIEPFEFFSVFEEFVNNFKRAKEDLSRVARAEARRAAGDTLLPVQHMRNEDIALPSHPVLGVTSKRL
ncbi:uncharacterized protein MONBRDRAFT_31999 [Monosiga brevicollis MX1]|uniref:FH2 domain-containing protein n=1 Tax=Monosiga brevicollis TaxID=81824 RepID=A9UWS2_MONBE|nr:uncharacterized protein MONBRDRAFT_31999 [Monosiga brevicollis MX1]EDQ90265.1 predicted protein [Monosiga brevicollis MX1]|eukprot:XP_001745032.1 hypothetical protein [Monosiga brevicollis MX1]